MLDKVKSEDGVVMVIAALMLVVLLGATALAIDTGRIYLTRTRLQKAADAAALAGAQQLIMTENPVLAEDAGEQYIDANLRSPYQASLTSDPASGQFSVTLSQDVNFLFAPVLGYRKKTVSVNAAAGASTIVRVRNVVPFGVLEQEFQYGRQYILKYGAGSDSGSFHGNYCALALGGNGANVYRNNIKYGYQGEIAVGDLVTTEPGNMAGPTDDGVSYRKSLCTNGCNYATQIEANCPRVVIAPVVDTLPNGRGQTTVKGFAAFFLEETQSGSKGQKDVVGRFLRWAATGQTDENGENYGVYSVRLIQ